jgi:hypothetical protein
MPQSPIESMDKVRQSPSTIAQFDRDMVNHKKIIGYAVAVLCLGTAMGNMFLAGNMKSVMKIKFEIPGGNPFKKASQSQKTQQSAGAGQQAKTGPKYSHYSSQGRARTQYKQQYKQNSAETPSQNDFLPYGIEEIPTYIKVHFKNLNLPVDFIVKEDVIKTAYRKEVMKYHPDRIGNGVKNYAELKKEYEGKFKEISSSYKFLLKNFSDRSVKSSMGSAEN